MILTYIAVNRRQTVFHCCTGSERHIILYPINCSPFLVVKLLVEWHELQQ